MEIFYKQLSTMGTHRVITCKEGVKPSKQKGIWFIQTYISIKLKWPMPLTTEVFQSYKPFTDILCE